MRRLALPFALLVLGLAAPAAADRETEAQALAERAEAGSAEALDALLPLVHDPDSRVRYHAEWGLARTGAAAVPALARELRRLEADQERARIARLLGRIGLVAETAVPELRAALAEPDSLTAGAASYALGHLRAREAVPDLVAAYTASRRIPNQEKMARALSDLGADQAMRKARAELVASVQAGLAADDLHVRRAHVTYTWALFRAAERDKPERFPSKTQLRALVPGLTAALRDPDPKLVEQAVKALALAGRGAEPALPELERLLGHPTLQHVAVEALLALGSPEAERVVEARRARAALDRRIRRHFSVHDHQGRTELSIFRVAGSAQDGLRMSARFLYPGREPRPPARVVLHLESTSMEPRFDGAREVTWLADGTPIRMTDLERTWSRSQLGGVIEQVSGTLALAEFLKISRARELAGEAGGLTFRLRGEDLAALRHFAAAIPAAKTP